MSKEYKRQQEQTRWKNTISNLFGAYMTMYDLFKKWHQDIIEDRNVVSPSKQKYYGGRIPEQKRKLLEWKDANHYQCHRKLVNVLIEYGLGFGQDDKSIEQNRMSITHHGAGQWMKKNVVSPRAISPQSMVAKNMSKTHRQLYGPVVDKSMAEKQLGNKLVKDLQPFKEHRQTFSYDVSEHSEIFEKSISIVESSTDRSVSHQQQKPSKKSRESMANQSNKASNVKKYQESIFDELKKSASIQTQKTISMHQASDTNLQVLQNRAFNNNNPGKVQKMLSVQEFQARNHPERSKSLVRRGNSTYDVRKSLDKTHFDSLTFHCPNNQKLVKEVVELREKLKKAETKVQELKASNQKVLSKYIQEDSNRKINFSSHSKRADEQAEIIKSQIESRFFDITDGLEPHIVSILNAKISQIRDFFVAQINTITYHSDCMHQKVALMESVNKDGIKFADLDTERLIEKLSQIEQVKRDQNFKLRSIDMAAKVRPEQDRPKVIWELLNKHFGLDYFMELIEQEYGIAPGHNDDLSIQIHKHFENDLKLLKKEHGEKEEHYKLQVGKLRDEIEDLVREKTQLMRRAERDRAKIEHENQKYAKLQLESAKVEIERRYNKSNRITLFRLEELSNKLQGQARSHKNMQLNYAWKRWIMFSKMKTLLTNLERDNKTGIDDRMLIMAEQFVREDFLVMFYSRKERRNSDGVIEAMPEPIPHLIVKDYINSDGYGKLKEKISELKHQLKHDRYLIQDLEQNIIDYQIEVSDLRLKQTELKLHVPALEAQNKLLSQTVLAKEEECRKLDEQVRNIESRWKSNAREGLKVTAKSILAALELKSLNERAAHKYRSLQTMWFYRRSASNAETITRICNLNYPLIERLPYIDKETEKYFEGEEVGVGDYDYRQWDVSCGKSRNMRLKAVGLQTDLHLDDTNFVESGKIENVQVTAISGHTLQQSMKNSQSSLLNPQTTSNIVPLKEFQIPIGQDINRNNEEQHQDSDGDVTIKTKLRQASIHNAPSFQDDLLGQQQQQSMKNCTIESPMMQNIGGQINMLKRQNTMKNSLLKNDKGTKHSYGSKSLVAGIGSHSVRDPTLRQTQKYRANRDIFGSVNRDKTSLLDRSRSDSQKGKHDKETGSKHKKVQGSLSIPVQTKFRSNENSKLIRQSSAGRSKNRDIKVPLVQKHPMQKFQSMKPKPRKILNKKQVVHQKDDHQMVVPQTRPAQPRTAMKKMVSMQNFAEKKGSQMSMQLAKNKSVVAGSSLGIRHHFATPISLVEADLQTTEKDTMTIDEEGSDMGHKGPHIVLSSNKHTSFNNALEGQQMDITPSAITRQEQQQNNTHHQPSQLILMSLPSSSLPEFGGIVENTSPLQLYDHQTSSPDLVLNSQKPKLQHPESPSTQFEGQAFAGTSSMFAHLLLQQSEPIIKESQVEGDKSVDEPKQSSTGVWKNKSVDEIEQENEPLSCNESTFIAEKPIELFSHIDIRHNNFQDENQVQRTGPSNDICSESENSADEEAEANFNKQMEDSMQKLQITRAIQIEETKQRRLTLVKEHEGEFGNVSSPQSSDQGGHKAQIRLTELLNKKNQVDAEDDRDEMDGDNVIVNFAVPVPTNLKERFLSESQKVDSLKMPPATSKKSKSRKSHDKQGGAMQNGHHDTFCTSDDTDSRYSVQIKTREQSLAAKKLITKTEEIKEVKVAVEVEQNQLVNLTVKTAAKQPDVSLSKIQKLKLKGYISEEQYLCLSLLEKGFIPHDPANEDIKTPPALSSNEIVVSATRSQSQASSPGRQQLTSFAGDPMLRAYNTQKAGFMSDNSYSHSPKRLVRTRLSMRSKKPICPNTQYRIQGNNITALEKMLEKAYNNQRQQIQIQTGIGAKSVFKKSLHPWQITTGQNLIRSSLLLQEPPKRTTVVVPSQLKIEGINQDRLRNLGDFSSARRSADQIYQESVPNQQRRIQASNSLAQTHSQFLAGSIVIPDQASFVKPKKSLQKQQKVLKLKINKNVKTAPATGAVTSRGLITSCSNDIVEQNVMQSQRLLLNRPVFTPPPNLAAQQHQDDFALSQVRSHKLIVPSKKKGRNNDILRPYNTTVSTNQQE